ncbi:ABC transporter ATP-binding protein/permease [Solimonas sp. K1W22B-7]|uniref:ABCB family ABC transporter ATP-binding protein/permease n=1 Tax=Solimonas sp. K1W22B-7 TaxID=2303331 RepID=UPI000E335D93|nr:ABC transporter ATP-binding protein/permease [Solimonas sp. K1W22B-7]AXQ31200.1 ABC transporter ATP-binding protein/permease [Solimonas sp. K1W22B-7]
MSRRLAAETTDDTAPTADWRVLRTLWPYLTEFPLRVSLALGFLLLAKLAGVALPMLLKHLVDDLDVKGDALFLVPLGLLLAYGAMRFAAALFGELRDLVFGRVSERAMRRAALNVFEHLHRLDLDFHLTRRTGGLSRDIERGISGISFLLRFTLFNIIPTLLEIALVAGILLFNYGASFALITGVSVALYVFFSVVVTEWRTQYVREANRLDSRANTRAVDSLLNYETVKLFGNEKHEAAEYDRFLAQWETAQQQQRLSLGALNAGQALIVAVALTWMMLLAAQQVGSGAMTLGDFVAVNAYIIQLFVPLNFLGFVYREIRRAMTDMQRMFGLLAQRPKVADVPGATELVLPAAAAGLSFENVVFGYSSKRRILHGVSFEVPPGRKIAVVGPSGSGKSTLARLLFRFYDPDEGAVRIGGHDIRGISQDSLRRMIGVVPQDTVLFNDTIRYNLAYGRPDATQEEIEQVVRLAHLDGFIAQLPEGYETRVGERGLKLSGGEKQRVAIARALLKNPAILVFDEATSSLDSGSEQAILSAIREVAARRTALVIAHRLSTITDADEILLLDHGRIAERGSHAQLLAAGGAYARLWKLQQRDGAEKT